MPDVSGQNQVPRNPDGTYPPGVSGNPKGKPKGARHLTTKIIEAITKVSDGEGSPEDEQLVRILLKKAKEGDMQAMKLIFNYVDGMPVQGIEHGGPEGGPITVITKVPEPDVDD